MAPQPFPLDFQPGIQRDGTAFDSRSYLDAQWCRWRLKRPRKMGGYSLITGAVQGIPRKIHGFYSGSQIYWHLGTTAGLFQVITDILGNFISTADRTPAAFTPGPNVTWSMDALFDTTSTVVQLVAHAVPDGNYVASTTQTIPYLGLVSANTPLTQFSNPGVSMPATWIQPNFAGSILCVQPFVFAFDIAGLVQWSAPNLALYLGVTGGSSGAGQARVSAQKLIAGAPLRGGGAQQPAAIFWSLSEVIVASYVGTPVWFSFSTVSPSSSILSANSVIEYDGLYFWAGVDRFLVFNGTVTEVKNEQNQDWFFNNLTPGYESLTFAFKVPRFGEIWWCACMFGSTVPNYACILNVRDNFWYDTLLPNGGRGAGLYAQGAKFPVMTGVVNGGAGPGSSFGFWRHENGVDQNINGTLSAIRSYYETSYFGGPANTPPDEHGIRFAQLEPDFEQTGDMQVNLIGTANARAPEVIGPTVTMPAVPAVPQEQRVSFTPTMPTRLLRLHVESNVVGGNYISGKQLGHGQQGDRRGVS